MRNSSMRKRLVLLSLSVVLVGVLGGASVATGSAKRLRAHVASSATISYAAIGADIRRPRGDGLRQRVLVVDRSVHDDVGDVLVGD